MEVFDLHADLLKALSHPARLAVLEILREGEQCVCHMEAILGLRQASISQQLMVLRETGLVDFRRDGLNLFYRVVKPDVYDILDAAYATNGARRPRLTHQHGKASCRCPKCNPPSVPPLSKLVHEDKPTK